MRQSLLFALLFATPAAAEDAFRWVAEPAFQDAGSAHQGVVPLLQGDVWGLMGANGQWVWPPQFDAVGAPGLGRFPVKKAGKWGVVDLNGKIVVSFDLDSIGTIDTLTPMQSGGAWYAVSLDNVAQPDPLPFDTLIGNEGACFAGLADGTPVTSWRGGTPLDQVLPEVESMSAPSEGYVTVKIGDKAGHMTCDHGNIVSGELALDEARRYAEGLAAARVGEGWGYVGLYDSYMEIGGAFQGAREFSEGLAPVKAGEKWGYIDRSGAWVIPAQFDQAYSFSDGLAGVQIGDKRGFVLPDGRMAAEPQFDDFWRHEGGIVPVQLGDLWGVIAPDATDPATRLNLPLAELAAAQKTRSVDYSLQPSNPHYYFFQDITSLHSISFAADESVMLTTLALLDNAEIALWDMKTQRLIRKFPQAQAVQAALLPGVEIVAVGLSTGHLLLLDAVSGAELFRVRPHSNAVIDMALSPDGKWLATADFKTVQLWNLETGVSGPTLPVAAHKVRFAADSQTLFAGTRRGGLDHLALDGAVLAQVDQGAAMDYGDGPQSDSVSEMALSANGTLFSLKTRSEEQTDGSFKTISSVEITTLEGRRDLPLSPEINDILTLDASADGTFLAYSGAQSEGDWVARTEVLNVVTGETVYSQTHDQNPDAVQDGFDAMLFSVDRLGFAPSGGLILVGMEGQGITFLDLTAGKVTASYGDRLTPVQTQAALLTGTRFFASDSSGKIWVWDLAQGRLETVLPIAETGGGVEETLALDGQRFYVYSGLEGLTYGGLDMETLAPIPIREDEQSTFLLDKSYPDAPTYSPEIQTQIDAISPYGQATVLAGGRLAVIASPVGLSKVHDLKTGDVLAQFLATPDGEWLIVTPEGFFAASPNGAKLVSVSNGLHAFSVDQVYQALYRPDLVQAKLAGDPTGEVTRAAAELDLGRIMGSGPAPYTRFSMPKQGTIATEPEVEIEIELQDEGGGIGRIEWRLNGVTVQVQPTRAAAALDSDTPVAKTRIALEPGENLIEVVAYNAADLLASAPRQLVINWDGVASTEPPALYVLSVGVNDYADGRLKLNYAAADALAFASAMEKAGQGLFASTNIVTLLDSEVTAANLDRAFADLGAKAKSQDVFLFFLAGHGKTIEGEYYFIPQDFRFAGDDPIRTGGIDQDRWQEWAARVKARKSVMIYDTCESGSITESRSVDAAMAQSAAVARLTRAIGRTILSASTDDAPALEGYQGHGVMTWAMLDALGQGDTNGNATIEVTELASYLDLKVPEISAATFGFRQVPQMSIKGSDFALGSRVSVLGDAAESFPATLSHVVAGGTQVLDAPGGASVQVIAAGVFYGVFRIEDQNGFARIAKDGRALGWVPAASLTPLQ
jgi:WD40 repeat protein